MRQYLSSSGPADSAEHQWSDCSKPTWQALEQGFSELKVVKQFDFHQAGRCEVAL